MKHIGKVTNVLLEKKYGFVRDVVGQDYFLHFSEFKGNWNNLASGNFVEFEPTQVGEKYRAKNAKLTDDVPPEVLRVATTKKAASPRVVGNYTGPTLDLTDDQRLCALREISRWKLEAKLDDIKRYFFAVPELNEITTGEASYVIGRKGTGKTALVQYLWEQSDDDLLVSKLTFKNFPFNELYGQENEGYRRPNQYITIWKLIIYSAACKMIAQSDRVDPLLKRKIDKAFPAIDSDNLGTIIGRWIAGDFGISILGSGVNVSKWFREKRAATLQDKVENLEQFVLKNLPGQKILVLFDELDEDYKDIFDNFNKSEYLDLLTSLFKAVQDVRSVMASRGRHELLPVIFLRDDIYDLLQDPDKNKWRDFEVDLEWRTEGIRGLLSHRLSKAMNVDGGDFDVLWYSLFSAQPVKYSDGKKEIRSFEYLTMSTQGRPRDYINYLQECADLELKRSRREISVDTIKDADKLYSNYLRKELIDEIHGILPNIAKILGLFSQMRKWILSIEEFRKAYAESIRGSDAKLIPDADMVLRTLFYFSAIGNVVRTGVHIFRHVNPAAELNFKEKIVVHRGLMKALQIV